MEVEPHVGVLTALHEGSPHGLVGHLKGDDSWVEDDGLGGNVLTHGSVSVEVVASERSQLTSGLVEESDTPQRGVGSVSLSVQRDGIDGGVLVVLVCIPVVLTPSSAITEDTSDTHGARVVGRARVIGTSLAARCRMHAQQNTFHSSASQTTSIDAYQFHTWLPRRKPCRCRRDLRTGSPRERHCC